MIPRAILPNVTMQMSGWELVVIMMAFLLIGAGLVMVSDWQLKRTELEILKKRFAKMSREYASQIIKLKGKK